VQLRGCLPARGGGRVLSFATSGMLYADNLVMCDRQTESLWPQLTGQAFNPDTELIDPDSQ
jgi:hypothetical protein